MPVDTIRVTNLTARYGINEAIKDIDFIVREGDFVGLVGPNGSGKSTLIKTILGLLKPSKGSISLFGTELSDFKDWHRVGYLPQQTTLTTNFFPCTVNEVVSMGFYRNKRGNNMKNKINKALTLLAIDHIGNRMIGSLSGGQLQRVLIARAIVNEPDLLILDEPTTAIDPETRDNFFALLKDLNSRQKTSILLITHDTGTIGEYANKLLYLDKVVIFFGTFDEFCHSEHMTQHFGKASQHIICHKH
ncbi:MAG: metal ABC transporter ATP-binding protein [Thermodesulfovibrionales bacterium]|nr:metal ABC transporter ATP-binding protein [Thermodesulfovibrionales bacterium]